MLPFLTSTAFLLGELLRIPVDIARGVRNRTYNYSFSVEAPKSVTWAVVSANKIRLEGTPPAELDTDPDPTRPGTFKGRCKIADRDYAFAYQILDIRPGEGLLLRVLQEECDPVYRLTDGHVVAVAVTGDESSSNVLSTTDVAHRIFWTRIATPIGVWRGGASLKRTAEAHAGRPANGMSGQVRSALVTGALTFASFFAMFGASIAAMLLALILVHELGHVIAMRWVGIPVRGIYFVPFFGGVAVGERAAGTQASRGLVALMGPGFSLLTTSLLLWLSAQHQEPYLGELALMSALLNGFNLLPIMPLDGGHVLSALLAGQSTVVKRAIEAAMLVCGASIAIALGDYVLLGLLVLIAPSIVGAASEQPSQLRPLDRRETIWLALAYAATFAFYAIMASHLAGSGAPGRV